jgi:hypothetical protein
MYQEIVYNEINYKDVLRAIMERKKENGDPISHKDLAQKIPIQATYLSKFFNDPNSHLKDETLYRLGIVLGLAEQESDHLITLKNFDTAETPERKEFLLRKISSIREQFVGSAEVRTGREQSQGENLLLLNPRCMIVHIALFIPIYKNNPKLLSSPLNISLSKLLEILDILEQNKLISRGENPYEIIKVEQTQIHYSKEHPLLRVHQDLFRSMISSRVSETAEIDKKSFVATFNMDRDGFDACLKEFQYFIEKIQSHATKAKDEGVYQIAFDFFKWI